MKREKMFSIVQPLPLVQAFTPISNLTRVSRSPRRNMAAASGANVPAFFAEVPNTINKAKQREEREETKKR